MIETIVKGAGTVVASIKEGQTRAGGGYANVLVRTDDGNVIRLQFWQETRESLGSRFVNGEARGERVGFHGVLRGTYNEKPSITCRLEDIRTSKD